MKHPLYWVETIAGETYIFFLPRELCFVRFVTPQGERKSVGGRNLQLVVGEIGLLMLRMEKVCPSQRPVPDIPLDCITDAFTFDASSLRRREEEAAGATERLN